MTYWDTIKNDFKTGKWVDYACMAIILFNLLALAASLNWFFDLFANFKIQYFAASVALIPLCLYYRRKWFALAMALIALGIVAEAQMVNSYAFYKAPPIKPNLTVVQYNKFYYNDNLDGIGAWLHAPENDFDVVIVNESSPEGLAPMKDKYGDILPHQYPLDYLHWANDISVLSKWPFDIAPIKMPVSSQGIVYNVYRVTIKKPGLQPVTIYAYHTQTPVGPHDYALRNFELESFADIVAKRTEKNVIMMGDWNITPFSPHFRHLLKTSGMKYLSFGLFPQATFPAYLKVDALQIPIDQILFDDSIVPLSIAQGPSNGSDHQSLIAKFYVNPVE